MADNCIRTRNGINRFFRHAWTQWKKIGEVEYPRAGIAFVWRRKCAECQITETRRGYE